MPELCEIISAYERHRSVWRAAPELGMTGQNVWGALKRAGYRLFGSRLTDVEKEKIVAFYLEADHRGYLGVSALVANLGRPRVSIERYAKQMGLTQRHRSLSPEHCAGISRRAKERIEKNGHPRGSLGMKHTPETLAKVSAASRRNWATWKAFGIGNASPERTAQRRAVMVEMRARLGSDRLYTRGRGGRRDDIGDIFLRSSWEANYARYLNLLKRLGAVTSWEYEPVTFWFNGVRRGTVSYRPDFRVFYKGDAVPEYIEIKGYKTPKDETKWRRMRKYYPDVKLVIVGEKQYRVLARKWSSSIPQWEGEKGGGGKSSPLLGRERSS